MPVQNKGITLVALMVTVIVLLMISTVGIYTSLDRFELNDYKKMKSDLELLEDKVSDYYLKYEGLPILKLDSNPYVFDYVNYLSGLTNNNQEPATNANDNGTYYIIDLEALGNITLNYGKDFEKYKSNNVVQNVDTDIYIINEESHTNNLLEYPQYTKPDDFRGRKVPDILKTGNHKKIADFRKNESIRITKKNRPDLLKKYNNINKT